jgi:phosphatidylserine/phosphatidylglycerophosphate/cardiolipin synthase-like enzyme
MTRSGEDGAESSRGLTDVALPDLRHLAGLLSRGELSAPFNTFTLTSAGVPPRCLDAVGAVLRGLDATAAGALLAAVIAERRYRPPPRLDLVWTGPEAKESSARDTRIVVRQLFEKAKSSVVLGGFAFDHGRDLFEPLYARMLQGVAVDMFLDIEQPKRDATLTGPAHAASEIGEFLKRNWPFGRPVPRIYYDPRTTNCGPLYASLHAKCVVVDEAISFVTSANFTSRGQTRNIEVGVLIEDPEFAEKLAGHWRGLVARSLVHRFQPSE